MYIMRNVMFIETETKLFKYSYYLIETEKNFFPITNFQLIPV